MIGELIDHYRVLELVGCGAMGVVYKALDVNLDRTVAVKVMGAAARNDPDFVERFRQEARLQAALNHPNVAQLFDYFVHDGAPVAVMEFIDGESFEQLIRRRGAIPAHEVMPLFRQALLGVAAAHRAGIIHRDLKPSNLMIAKGGTVKVMDFGIARRQGVTGATRFGSTSIGSPLYMAPEQILGRAVDCRTDVYSLGVTLYELLSGQKPFNPRGKTEYSLLNAHVNDLPEPPTVHCRDIPGPVVDVVLRALSKEPEARFQSADEFMHALPDVPAPGEAAPKPTGTVGMPRKGPTGTVVIPRVGPTGTVAIPRADPSDTVAIEYSPPMSEDSARAHRPSDTMAFDYSAGTALQELQPQRSAQSPAPPPAVQGTRAARPGFTQRPRADRRVILGVGVLVAALVLGILARHTQRHAAAVQDDWVEMRAPRHPAAPPPAEMPAATVARAGEPAAPPSAVPATATTLATTAALVRQDLSGTWRGEYIDASGNERLRVVSLSISRVNDDGGIEGTLQYEAASGEGECKLHPRGSIYSAGGHRLQLSPEGCSPHYPKELGVPLDFDRVNPQANTLNDGRIEAPTGEVISVRLRRVRGV